MNTYLSIDLDYFSTRSRTGSYSAVKNAERCLSRALDLDVPKIIVISHEQMMDHITNFDRLINVDHHSDMCARFMDPNEPQNYDWVNHLPCKGRIFEWRHPYDDIDSGLCDTEAGDFFIDPKTNYGWEKVSRKKGLRGIWGNVIGIGFALSPEWTDKKIIDLFLDLLGKEPIYKELQEIIDEGYKTEDDLSTMRLEWHWGKFKKTVFEKKKGEVFRLKIPQNLV